MIGYPASQVFADIHDYLKNLEDYRGDIVLCDLNPVIGTEQSDSRPVVIVQSDRAS